MNILSWQSRGILSNFGEDCGMCRTKGPLLKLKGQLDPRFFSFVRIDPEIDANYHSFQWLNHLVSVLYAWKNHVTNLKSHLTIWPPSDTLIVRLLITYIFIPYECLHHTRNIIDIDYRHGFKFIYTLFQQQQKFIYTPPLSCWVWQYINVFTDLT